MVLPLPKRISYTYAIGFAIVMMVLQLMEKTSGAFIMFHFAFVMISVMAFNVAGGMTTASGWYIFFFTTFSVLFGTVLKAVLGEPADSTSVNAVLTMQAFTVGLAGILLATVASRALTRDIPSLAVRMGGRQLNYQDASLGCTILGLFIDFLRYVLPAGPGSIVAALTQLDIFFPLAILLGTIAVVESSNRRRCLGLINALPMLLLFLLGVLTFSKQGMLTPLVCWLIGVAYARFSLKLFHFVVLGAFSVLTLNILYPISQVGRNIATENDGLYERALIVADMLSHLKDTEQILDEAGAMARESLEINYFNHNVGFAERFTRWPGDDQLINFSQAGHYIGYSVITSAFMDWFPHVLLPQKDATGIRYGGNYYVHEMGGLADDDTTTGISFSAVAEAFHVDGWAALVLAAPPIWFLLFLTIDLLCGDLRETPWGLFFAIAFAHVAPESGLAGVIAFIWHGNLSLFVGMLFCFNAAPFVGAMITGASRRSRVLQQPTLQSPTSVPTLDPFRT